jgi:hypothetical protein
MTLSALGIFSAAGAGGGVALSDYELIETQILGSSQASITFSSLGTYSSTYKHLQIRAVVRGDRGTFSQDQVQLFLNGDETVTNYSSHKLEGQGVNVQSSAGISSAVGTYIGRTTATGSQTGAFSAHIVDVLDAYSTTKNKTIRTLFGQESQDSGGFPGRFVGLNSNLFISTASVTSLKVQIGIGTNFIAGSRFSLYGIKG